eukprot:3012410-Rhodomonas_salina.1
MWMLAHSTSGSSGAHLVQMLDDVVLVPVEENKQHQGAIVGSTCPHKQTAEAAENAVQTQEDSCRACWGGRPEGDLRYSSSVGMAKDSLAPPTPCMLISLERTLRRW